MRAVSPEVRLVLRARIVLCAAEGLPATRIAREVGCSEPTVCKWRARYECNRLQGLTDAPRSGALETYNQTAKPFKWTYAGKVVEA